ncbi:MAG: rhodanese-like domain-containing protein [Chloroflexi bacterium]|nr:MAG: rhodanese-like domain-containing protein [Chloroflexota bacterium]
MLDEWMRGLTFDYWSTGQHKIEPPAFMEKWARGEAVLLDVRDEAETEFISFPFALHIPIYQLPDRLDEIPRDKLVATFCSGGDRANVAFAYLHAHGFDNVRILKGGYGNLFPELLPGKVRKLKQA